MTTHRLPTLRPDRQLRPHHQSAPLYDGLNETASLSLHLMLDEWLSIAAIATRRGLNETTIFGHCADAIACGLVVPEAVIPLTPEERTSIAAALCEQRASGEPRLKSVFDRFEGRYDYGVLKCVAAALSCADEVHGSG